MQSQEEIYDAALRDLTLLAQQLKRKSENLVGWEEKLNNCKEVKVALNRLYNIMKEIQENEMFNKYRKDMCINVFKILSELLKSGKGNTLKEYTLN